MDKYLQEKQTRERIMQILLIISGFLLAYSKDSIVNVFILFILFALLYYIYLTRTENNFLINLWGFYSAFTFSLLLLFFMDTQKIIGDIHLIILFFLLTSILTFALLSPETSEKSVAGIEKK